MSPRINPYSSAATLSSYSNILLIEPIKWVLTDLYSG